MERFFLLLPREISEDFDEQIDECDILFGKYPVKFYFDIKDVEQILGEFQGIYEPEILNRVYQLMKVQIRKYAYLFEFRN